jgi:DNA-binding CsgD family transcriptional regulator
MNEGKNMILRQDHYFLTSIRDLTEIAKPLRKLGITYFSYMKSEPNGARIYLESDVSTLEDYIQRKYYLAGNTESNPAQYKSQCVLWSTLPKQYIYDGLIRVKNVDHGMFMFDPSSDFCENYAFATHKSNYQIVNTYVNNLDVLKNFVLYFKEKAASILKEAEKHKLILPFCDDNVDFLNDKNTFNFSQFVNDDHADLQLTERQWQCSEYLIQGKTIKEIAKQLGLSPRTIEFYVNNLKSKLQCRNKAELIFKLAKILKEQR